MDQYNSGFNNNKRNEKMQNFPGDSKSETVGINMGVLIETEVNWFRLILSKQNSTNKNEEQELNTKDLTWFDQKWSTSTTNQGIKSTININ